MYMTCCAQPHTRQLLTKPSQYPEELFAVHVTHFSSSLTKRSREGRGSNAELHLPGHPCSVDAARFGQLHEMTGCSYHARSSRRRSQPYSSTHSRPSTSFNSQTRSHFLYYYYGCPCDICGWSSISACATQSCHVQEKASGGRV